MNTETGKVRAASLAAKKKAVIGSALIKAGAEPFTSVATVSEAENTVHALCDSRNLVDAQLSYMLHYLQENSAHLDADYENFSLYVEKSFGFAGDKARSLIQAWDAYCTVGLPLSALGGDNPIVWGKFQALVPAIKKEVITEQNILEWVPSIVAEGEHSTTIQDLQNQIRVLTVAEAAAKEPDGLTSLSLKVSHADKEDAVRLIELLKETMGVKNDGSVLMSALRSQVALMDPDSLAANINTTIANITATVSKMAPGTSLVLLGHPESKLSVPVYQAFLGTQEDGTHIVALAVDAESTEDLMEGTTFEPVALLNTMEAKPGAINPETMSEDELKEFIQEVHNKIKAKLPEVTEAFKAKLSEYRTDFNGDNLKVYQSALNFLMDIADENDIEL